MQTSPSTSMVRPPLRKLIDPKHTALLIVDMQNDYCSRKGVLAKQGANVRPVEEMAPRLARFLAVCRQLGILIAHTRMVHSQFTDTPAWLHRGGAKNVARANSWGAEWYEGHPEFVPKPNEYLVTKHRYSAFLNTDLEQVLKSRGVSTMLITGTSTNVCVESTARDAVMRDFDVVLVSDCSATTDRRLQEATEINIQRYFGSVKRSTSILRAWRRNYRLNSRGAPMQTKLGAIKRP